MKNKKGIVLEDTFTFIIMSFVFIIILGTFIYIFGVIDTSLSGGNIMAGQVNFSNESANTIGKLNTGLINAGDLIGILFLFGMVIGMILSGYVNRNSTPAIFFIVDFLIMIFAYIMAVYISNSYETILGILPFADIFISNLGNSSRFLLLLPKITLVATAITLIVTYAGIPRTKEEEVAGF